MTAPFSKLQFKLENQLVERTHRNRRVDYGSHARSRHEPHTLAATRVPNDLGSIVMHLVLRLLTRSKRQRLLGRQIQWWHEEN